MIILSLLAGVVAYSPQAMKQLITNLPGLPSDFKPQMFSGYIEVKDNTRGLFYWFVESESNPETDPIVFWTNGGPGCSGMDGLLTEQGPFKPQADGTLEMNDFRWNQAANMLFIEQPAGVGFSWTTQEIVYGDEQAASDNADFLEGWFSLFSNFAMNDFYITSESYGGHYMPTLTRELVRRAHLKNFKGMMVGNPLTYMPYRNYGQWATAAGRNMYPKPEWDEYNKRKCGTNNTSVECEILENKFFTYTTGTDPYALDFPVCNSEKKHGREQRFYMARTIKRANENRNKKLKINKLGAYFPEKYEACVEDHMAAYLRRTDVRQALHVRQEDPVWEMCNNVINGGWNQTDFNAPMMPVYDWLVNNAPHLKIMIYSGDDDSMCATFGTQMFLWNMNWPITSPWQSWQSDGQLAGYVVKFEGFSFVTVHGAGHMVPATRPSFAYDVFTKYLSGAWF